MLMDTIAKRDKTHIDFLRIVAIIFVICNHLGDCGIYPSSHQSEWQAAVTYLYLFLIKMAVPFFFMISGALLIPKEENFQTFFTKRVLRAVGIMFVFFVVQMAYYMAGGYYANAMQVGIFFLRFVFNDFSFAIVSWFLYTYFTLILLLPLIRKLAVNCNHHHFYYLMAIQVIFCALFPSLYTFIFGKVTVFYTSGCTTTFPVPFSVMYGIFYMLLGYFLESRIGLPDNKTLLKWLFAGIAMTVIPVLIFVYYVHTDCWKIDLLAYLSVPTFSIYLALRRFFSEIQLPIIVKKLIAFLGSTVFMVMVTENIFRDCLHDIFKPWIQGDFSIFFIALYVVCIWLCATLFAVVLKRIPFLNRVI